MMRLPRTKMKLPRAGFLIPILFLFILTSVFVYKSFKAFSTEGPLLAATTIIINKGADLDDIARLLESENIIRSGSVFRLGVRAYGMSKKLKAGEFFIPIKSSPEGVMKILVSGKTVTRSLTIPEGLTSETIVNLINNAKGLEGDLITEIPKNGDLMPETYHYQYGMKRIDLFNRVRNSMKNYLDANWDKRALELPFSNRNEALALASIVERETSLPSEYKTVASVYINRLKKGMKLQADPTVIFAVTGGKMDMKRSPYYDELKLNHPYNTYFNRGLPPGPICNPGKGAIDAVLTPENTTYLFFVADGKGGHVFTSNFKEHWAKAERWRKINKKNTRKQQLDKQKSLEKKKATKK